MVEVFIGAFPPGPKIEAGDDIDYGTHTIPNFPSNTSSEQRRSGRSFWTSGKPGILKDDGFKARRRAKSARRVHNVEARRQDNINRASGVTSKHK